MAIDRLLAVDHSARTSMKSAANCAKGCELQDIQIIENSNANGSQCFKHWLRPTEGRLTKTYISMFIT